MYILLIYETKIICFTKFFYYKNYSNDSDAETCSKVRWLYVTWAKNKVAFHPIPVLELNINISNECLKWYQILWSTSCTRCQTHPVSSLHQLCMLLTMKKNELIKVGGERRGQERPLGSYAPVIQYWTISSTN